MTGTPAVVDAIEVVGCMTAVLCQCTDKAVQWCSHLCEICHECWPVVLLQIDVHRVVAAPG